MEGYPIISVFMRDVLGPYGHLDDEEIFASLVDNLSDSILREGLALELPRAFADSGFSWSENLKDLHGFPEVDEDSARAYAVEFLWQPVFGDVPPPSPKSPSPSAGSSARS